MTVIRVNPEELEQTAYQLHAGIRDMDEALRDAYQQLQGIRDRARGLDDIRSRAADLYRMHRAQTDVAQQVHQHIVQSAQRFSNEDRQLSEMVHSRHTAQLPYWQQMLGTVAVGTLTYGQILEMMSSFSNTTREGIEQLMAYMGGAKEFFAHFEILNQLNRTDVREALLNIGRNANDIAQLLGVNANFVGKMQGVYDAIKGFVPDGRTGFGQFIKDIGGSASTTVQMLGNVMTYGSLALSVIGLVDPTIKAFKTGDFREVKDLALTAGAEFLVNKLVVGGAVVAVGLLAGTTTATVGGVVAAGVAVTVLGTELIQGVGGKLMDAAEWAGFTEFAEGGRDILNKIEVKDRLVAGTKWFVESTATGIVEVINHPQESLQNSINYLGEKTQKIVCPIGQNWLNLVTLRPVL